MIGSRKSPPIAHQLQHGCNARSVNASQHAFSAWFSNCAGLARFSCTSVNTVLVTVCVRAVSREDAYSLQLISVLVQAAVFIEQDLYGMRHITDCPIEGQLQPKLGEYQGALTKLEVLKEPSSLNFL